MRSSKLRFLAVARCPPQLEQLALAVQRRAQRPVDAAGKQLGWETRLSARSRSLGEPCLAGPHLVEAFGDDGEVGARDGLVEPHHDVAGANAVAVAHEQFADDAAGQVLHLLDVGIDDDRAGRDHRAR